MDSKQNGNKQIDFIEKITKRITLTHRQQLLFAHGSVMFLRKKKKKKS